MHLRGARTMTSTGTHRHRARWALGAVVLAGLLVGAWWRLSSAPVATTAGGATTAEKSSRRERAQAPLPLVPPELLAPEATAAAPPPAAATPPSAATGAREKTAAETFLDNFRRAQHRQVVCAYGKEGEELDAMPLGDAWPRIEDKLLKGDAFAAEVLLSWAEGCDQFRQLGAQEYDRRMALALDERVRELDPASANFVAAATRSQLGDDREVLADCRAGMTKERILDLLARRASSVGVPADQVAAARAQGDFFGLTRIYDPKASGYSECFERNGLPDYWGPHAFDDAGAADRWQRLIAAAAPGSDLDLALRACRDAGCTSLDQVPPEYHDALRTLLVDLGSARELSQSAFGTADPVRRYELGLYSRWLTQAGCDLLSTTDLYVVQTQQLLRQGRDLTPEQRALATAAVRQRIARYGGLALQLRGCGS